MKYMKGQVQPNMPNLAERTEAIQLSVPRSHTIPEEFLWFGQINFTGKTFDLVYSPTRTPFDWTTNQRKEITFQSQWDIV